MRSRDPETGSHKRRLSAGLAPSAQAQSASTSVDQALWARAMSKIETPRPIRGTQDMLGEQALRFGAVVDAFDRVRRLYGFGRVEIGRAHV